MAKYGVLFQYLLRLKRIAAELDETWAVMRRQALRGRGQADHERRLPLWHLRHHMAYMVANLQIYLQVGRTWGGSPPGSAATKSAMITSRPTGRQE